ncbi:MAG: LytTR family DNA-binding domain-containing protein [Candidatus Acidiferrum sp.]
MRVLIVDKEPVARSALAEVLATRNDIGACDSVDNVTEALNKLQKEEYDILLLGSSVPEMSEIGLVDCLRKRNRLMPAIIFVSAYRHHAVATFEKHAVEYVRKPFSSQRIHEALDTAIHRKANERAASLVPQLWAPAANPSKIAIAMEGRVLLIDPEEVIAVEAEGNYVSLVRSSGSYLVRGSISTIAEKLRSYGFIRIHRGVLVNASWVQGIHPRKTGKYLLCTRGGREYPVSRKFKQNLRALAPLWIGSDALFA